MNLPNRLTIFRIVLIPVIILVYLFPYASFGIEPSVFTIGNTSISIVNIIALVIYVVAALTDALDGHIARSRNMITTFGKFADPIAYNNAVSSVSLTRHDSVYSGIYHDRKRYSRRWLSHDSCKQWKSCCRTADGQAQNGIPDGYNRPHSAQQSAV